MWSAPLRAAAFACVVELASDPANAAARKGALHKGAYVRGDLHVLSQVQAPAGGELKLAQRQACPGMLWVEVDEATLPFLELVIGTEQHVRVGGLVKGHRLAR